MVVNRLKEKQIDLHDEVQFAFLLSTVTGDVQPLDESVALLPKSSENK